jgi:hypothetical protein
LPGRRTAHLTPDVTWQSYILGDGYFDLLGFPIRTSVALSITPETTYAAGSRQTLAWLRRPMAPGPVGVPLGRNFCQPRPVERTGDTLTIDLAAFQDRRDAFGCEGPLDATLTLERAGAVIGTASRRSADFTVPAEPGGYRLTYEQSSDLPYLHHSSTTWSFRSAGGAGAASTRIPLLVVDYRLPLDTLNRPTGRTATFTVHQVTGTDQQRIRSLRVWTSADDGTTWRRASVERRKEGEYRVTLPHVAHGTGVSLRVDARDAAGNRIEQTLDAAYTGA